MFSEKNKNKLFRALPTALAALLIIAAICAALSCSATGLYTEGEGELNVVCTNFPPFDLSREVGGDKVTLTVLQSSGADLHNFSPTSKTMIALKNADVLVCVGGDSDNVWLEGALASAANPGLLVVRMTECVELICSEDIHTTEPHDHGHGEEESEEEHGHGEEEHGHAHDEHVWTSLRNSQLIVTRIAEAFAEKDGENAGFYRANAVSYNEKLADLDRQYLEATANAKRNVLLFADRFPFAYMTEDYDLIYYAAFSGCSTEVNASFETASALIDAVNKHSLPAILIIDVSPDSPPAVASTVASSTGARILSLNSCQAVGRKQIEEGATYLGIMTENLNVLKEALN